MTSGGIESVYDGPLYKRRRVLQRGFQEAFIQTFRMHDYLYTPITDKIVELESQGADMDKCRTKGDEELWALMREHYGPGTQEP